ncbi:hypothetical protein QN277_006363 [Acacia crassicarpa]|uniref:Uncharacterized protein n=1 Tax=Acacia crassicarpa TaxID=499986 RepID=A0AAE1JP26_9FABA|nr:hypothetical protein QN277_006363 [Acacia crassicarpa]
MHQNYVEKHEDKLDQRKEQFADVDDDRKCAAHDLDEVTKKDEDANSRFDVASTTKAPSEPQTGLNSSPKANSTQDKALPAENFPDSQAELSSSPKDEISDGQRNMALPAKKPSETRTELNSSAKDAISNMKENYRSESLKHEANREFELLLAEKQATLDRMKKEVDDASLFEQDAVYLLSECKRRINELEDKLDKSRASEATLYEALVMKTKQHDQNKILFEEAKLEIASLKESVVKLKESQPSVSMKQMEGAKEVQVESGKLLKEPEGCNKLDPEEAKTLLQQMSLLRNELELATEGEERDSVAKSLLEELKYLKNELKLAMKAEENSKTALDDLALALNEVATESRQTKEKLVASQVELQQSKEETEDLKALLNRTEDNYKQLLREARTEAERNKNTAERLRLEAEESLLAWNEKTKEFVDCIKRSEEERTSAQEECRRLQAMFTETENKIRVSKEENQKLRDILKQALNEANVAKEAAGIAQAENAQLKDLLGERDETLKKLTRENEMLKIDEAAAFKNIKELKRLLAEAPIRELKNYEEREKEKYLAKETNKGKAHKEGDKEVKGLSKAISFNLKEIIAPHKQQAHKESNEEPIKEIDDDDLKGSIFDEIVGDIVIPESYEIDESQLDDPETNSRKRSALLRKFGALIIRRKSTHTHKKEPSISNDDRLNLISPRP